MSEPRLPSEEKRGDLDAYTRAMAFVGSLQLLEKTAGNCLSMPCDAATGALIEAIKDLTKRAVVCAWGYANQYKPEQDHD